MHGVGKSLERYSLSSDVVNLIMKSWSFGTPKQYSSQLKRWFEFSSKDGVDPFVATISNRSQFPIDSFLNSKSEYSSANTATSALSANFLICWFSSRTFGKYPVVQRLLREIFKKRKGKHVEGNFQHDFVCKHKSQDKLSVKKPVPVCNKMRNYCRNTRRDVFLGNKSICQHTVNVLSYPSISINKLSKKVKAGKKTLFTYFKISGLVRNAIPFYDTGCCDMVLRYQVVKEIGNSNSRATKTNFNRWCWWFTRKIRTASQIAPAWWERCNVQ